MNISRIRPGNQAMLQWVLAVVVSLPFAAHAEPFHKTSSAVGYKCIFDHELLIVCHNKTNSAVNVQEANLP